VDKPDRPLVTNPLAHVLLGAIHNPESLGPMLKDALKQTAGTILEEMGVHLKDLSPTKPPDDGAR